MSKDMKLIMENWRSKQQESLTLLEMCGLDESERMVFNHSNLEEGVIAGLLDKVKNTYEKMKDWTKEKTIEFVKKMGNGYVNFIGKMRQKGIFKKYRARKEQDAMKLLLTNKHIDLALLILTSLFNMVGGYAVEGLMNAKEKFETFLEVTEQIRSGDWTGVVNTLFGEDPPEVVDIIKKAMEFSKDLNDPKMKFKRAFGNFEEFGGLAEVLKLLEAKQ